MLAGADCVYTLSDDTESMDLDEFIDFLEAAPSYPDPDHPGEMIPEKGPALCQSAEDWNKMKTVLEQLCKKYKGACTYEMTQVVTRMSQLANFRIKKR